jgi:hypothetical protein
LQPKHNELRIQKKKFLACVVDTGGKFTIVVDTGGKFAKVSTPVVQEGKYTAGVVHNGGKFLPQVSLIPVAHLDLRTSQRIFQKIRNGPDFIFMG